jgi:hypothetical protein
MCMYICHACGVNKNTHVTRECVQVLKQHGFIPSTSAAQSDLEGGKENVLDAVHLIQCYFARDPLTGERCILINETDISRMKGVQVLVCIYTYMHP